MATLREALLTAFDKAVPRVNVFCSMRRTLAMLFLLAGCVNQIDQKAADLMPTQAAQEVFRSNGFAGWAAQPFLFKGAICGHDKIYVNFQDIDHAKYLVLWQKLVLFRNSDSSGSLWCPQGVEFHVSKEIAYELVKAARALGARIDDIVFVSLPPIERFAADQGDADLAEMDLLGSVKKLSAP